MKIRSGFVSNSSSSSFILDANKYNCVDVAKDMARTLYSGYDGDQDVDENEKYLSIIENLDKLEDKNTAIFIDACDDIHICKSDNKIYVEGSNHYDWNLNYYEEDEEGAFYDFYMEQKFYFPEYDNKVLGKLKDWDKNYKYKDIPYRCKCGATHWIEIDNNELMCPKCYCDPDGNKIHRLFRENKLERILKDETI